MIAFLQTDRGQNWLADKVTARLSKELQSHISIGSVQIGFFDKLNLEKVLIEDRNRDTLLSAGIVQVRITDWFFFKDKADLEYIGLENAVIKLQRTDSVWNYDFLVQYFDSPNPSKKNKESGIDFNFKKVILKNISFTQRDAWVGKDLYVRLGAMDLDAKEISAATRRVNITDLNLEQPYIHMFNYEGRRPPKSDTAKTVAVPKKEGLQWNPQNWLLQVARLTVKDGNFRNDQKTLGSSSPYFDGAHLDFGKINGSITNMNWMQDTLKFRAELAARERSGLLVQALKADATFHPEMMEFASLLLKTNRSVLKDYFAMRYESMASMSNFLHEVTMNANFNGSIIYSDDIAFFAPSIRSWNRNMNVNGKIKGTVDALSATDLTLQSGAQTLIKGDVSLVGLPDISKTYINLRAKELRTTYSDAVSFVPALRNITNPNIRQLGSIRFNGEFTGFINDFVTFGTIRTDLGTLMTDVNMKLPSGKAPVYSGSLRTQDFQLGRFINNPQLGAISFSGDLKGKGFDLNTLDLTLDGKVQKVRYGKYTYQNITAKGRVSNRMFDGKFVVKDPNADLSLTGVIDFRTKRPLFDLSADVAHINLFPLQLAQEDIRASGRFNLNFQGASLDDFIGSARISNASFVKGGQNIAVDSLVLTSGFEEGVKTLSAKSDQLDATVKGTFDLQSLPDAFTVFLSRYYPAYIRPPRRQIAQQQSFSFDIRTGIVEDYIRLIDKRLSGLNNSHITGSLDIPTNTMTVDATIPQFAFQQYDFSDVQLNGKGNLDSLVLAGSVGNAVITDSLNLPQTTFRIHASNDISDITISTTANRTINQANLSARVQTFSDGALILFRPSSFVLNGKTWTVEEGGELNFRRNTVVQGQLVLRESQQEVRIITQPSEEGDWNDLLVTLGKVNLGDFSPFLLKKNRVEGLLSGEIRIEDPQNRFNVFSELTTDQLRLDNDSVGQVKASLGYINSSGMLTVKGNNLDPEHQVLFDVGIDLKDSANTFEDRISVSAVNYHVGILERFIGTLFSDLQGYVTGTLNILGEGANRRFVGKARLKDAALKVNFTQVHYKLDDAEIELEENRINFGTLRLRDRFGNTATVEGDIKHTGFSDMQFDLVARVDSRQMELLNTNLNDNQTFYGRAMGKGTLILAGPQDDMFMDISIQASETDSSYITLPPSRTRESGSAAYMVEKKYGEEMTGPNYQRLATNIRFDVRLVSNPHVNVEVILDELTGDVIRGRGFTEDLRIIGGTTDPLSISGTYAITEGNYLFTFQSFLKKPFELRKGTNNYIKWSGDPYDATIRFDAVYHAEQVDFTPLASALNLERKGYRGDVDVLATLTGELFRPTFNFGLEFPDPNVSNNPSIQFGRQQIERNPNELNKQVSYLIVFNSFAPLENTQSSNAGIPLNEFAYNTISGLFFGEVNRRLNQLLSKILRNNDLTFNFTGSVYNRNLVNTSSRGFDINHSNLNLSVGMPIFNDRFQFTLGSTFDVPLGANIQQSIQFLPDVTLEWLINKTGSIRATFFYRKNLDYFGSTASGSGIRTQRSGASIAYRKEFDDLTDFLFGRKRRRQQMELPRLDSIPPQQVRRDSTPASGQ